MKNVLIITHYFPPESVGRASRIFELVKFLKNHYNILILCPPPTFPFTKFEKVNYFSKKEKFEGLDLLRLKTYQPQNIKISFFQRVRYYMEFPFFCSWFIFFKLRKFETIIISTPPPAVLFVTLIARLLHKRIIIDVGDLWETIGEEVSNYPYLRKMIRNFEINCWKKSDAIITNNLTILEIIKKIIGGNNSDKIKYFPYNVDKNIFKKQNVEQENQIIYIGTYGGLQNLEIIIRALPLILKENSDLKLQLYGGGDKEPELKKLVKELHLEKNCIFNDPIPRNEISLVLSKSKIGIVPLQMKESLRYAMPTKAFEFLSCGLPILSYGGSKEMERICEQSKAGISVSSDDPKKIADVIIQILKDDSLLKKLASNAREFVEKSSDYSKLLEVI